MCWFFMMGGMEICQTASSSRTINRNTFHGQIPCYINTGPVLARSNCRGETNTIVGVTLVTCCVAYLEAWGGASQRPPQQGGAARWSSVRRAGGARCRCTARTNACVCAWNCACVNARACAFVCGCPCACTCACAEHVRVRVCACGEADHLDGICSEMT